MTHVYLITLSKPTSIIHQKNVHLKPPNVCLWYIELMFGSILAPGRRIYEELYLDSFRLATSKRDLQACPMIEMGPPQVAWTLSSVSRPLFKFDQLLFFNTKIVHMKSPNVWFWYIELGLCSLLVLDLCIICEKPIDSFKLEASKQHMSRRFRETHKCSRWLRWLIHDPCEGFHPRHAFFEHMT